MNTYYLPSYRQHKNDDINTNEILNKKRAYDKDVTRHKKTIKTTLNDTETGEKEQITQQKLKRIVKNVNRVSFK